MADKTERLGIEFSTSYKGSGAQKAERAMKGVARSTGRLAVEQGVAQVKAAQLQRKLGELSQAVAANTKTVDQATKEYKEYQKELGLVAKETEGAKKSTSGFDAKLGALAGAGAFMAMNALQNLTRNVTAFVSESIGAASTMQETESLLRNALGPAYDAYSQQLEEFGDIAKRSRIELEQGSSTIVAMTRSMGASREEAADMGVAFAKMATDLGSYFNQSTEQVFLDIRSALAGSVETLQKYGIDARETALQQAALNMGYIEAGEKLDRLTRAQTIQNIVMQQASDAMGDAARTSDSYENTQKGLAGAVLELKVAFGEMLLPTITNVVGGLTDVVDVFDSLIDIITGEHYSAVVDATEASLELADGIEAVKDKAVELAELDLNFGDEFTKEAKGVRHSRDLIVPALAEQAISFEKFFEALESDELSDYTQEMLDAIFNTWEWRRAMKEAGREAVLLSIEAEDFKEVAQLYYDQIQRGIALEKERAGLEQWANVRNKQAADLRQRAIDKGPIISEAQREHNELLLAEAEAIEERNRAERATLKQSAQMEQTQEQMMRHREAIIGTVWREARARRLLLERRRETELYTPRWYQEIREHFADLGAGEEIINDVAYAYTVLSGETLNFLSSQTQLAQKLDEAELAKMELPSWDITNLEKAQSDIDTILADIKTSYDNFLLEIVARKIAEKLPGDELAQLLGLTQIREVMGLITPGRADEIQGWIGFAREAEPVLSEMLDGFLEDNVITREEAELLTLVYGNLTGETALWVDELAKTGSTARASEKDLSYLEHMDTVLEPGLVALQNLNAELDDIAGDYDANVRINMQFPEVPPWIQRLMNDPNAFDVRPSGPPGSNGNGGGPEEPTAPGGPQGYQSGGHFIVPPGGPYPMIVHPGEIVDVWNAGQRMASRSGGRGASINIHEGAIVVYGSEGQSAVEIAEEVQMLLADDVRMSAVSGAGGMGR